MPRDGDVQREPSAEVAVAVVFCQVIDDERRKRALCQITKRQCVTNDGG